MRKGPTKPFFRKSDRWWVFCRWQSGKRIQEKLCQGSLPHGEDTKPLAYSLFSQRLPLILRDTPILDPRKPLKIQELALLFHQDNQRNQLAPESLLFYHHFIDEFTKVFGSLFPAQLSHSQVQDWLNTKTSWKSSQHCAVKAIRRLFNWALGEDLLQKSPVQKLRRPPTPVRSAYLTREQRQILLAHYSPGGRFHDLLTALELTGARPGEVSQVSALDVDWRLDAWVLTSHKTSRRTAKPRLIPMVPALKALTLKLAQRHPTGPLFRNRRGDPWNRKAIEARFQRARKILQIPGDICAYYYRSSVATDLLETGVPLAQAAEILGNSPQVLHKHYSRLSQRVDHLREQLMKISPPPMVEEGNN